MDSQQEYYRVMIEKIIDETGVKAAFICKVTGIDQSEFSRFRRGYKYLDEDNLEKLRDYINQRI